MDVSDSPSGHKRNNSSAEQEITALRKNSKIEAVNLDSMSLELIAEIFRWISITDVYRISDTCRTMKEQADAIIAGNAGIGVLVSMLSRSPVIPSAPFVFRTYLKYKYRLYSTNTSYALLCLSDERMQATVARLPSYVLHMVFEDDNYLFTEQYLHKEMALLRQIIKSPQFPLLHPLEQDPMDGGMQVGKYRILHDLAFGSFAKLLPDIVQWAPSALPRGWWDIDVWWKEHGNYLWRTKTTCDKDNQSSLIRSLQALLSTTYGRFPQLVASIFILIHGHEGFGKVAEVWRKIVDPIVAERRIHWNWSDFVSLTLSTNGSFSRKTDEVLMARHAMRGVIVRLWRAEITRLHALSPQYDDDDDED